MRPDHTIITYRKKNNRIKWVPDHSTVKIAISKGFNEPETTIEIDNEDQNGIPHEEALINITFPDKTLWAGKPKDLKASLMHGTLKIPPTLITPELLEVLSVQCFQMHDNATPLYMLYAKYEFIAIAESANIEVGTKEFYQLINKTRLIRFANDLIKLMED